MPLFQSSPLSSARPLWMNESTLGGRTDGNIWEHWPLFISVMQKCAQIWGVTVRKDASVIHEYFKYGRSQRLFSCPPYSLYLHLSDWLSNCLSSLPSFSLYLHLLSNHLHISLLLILPADSPLHWVWFSWRFLPVKGRFFPTTVTSDWLSVELCPSSCFSI